jgi:hypothetical protein
MNVSDDASVLRAQLTRTTFARLNRATPHPTHANTLSSPRSGGMTRIELLPGRLNLRLGLLA